MKLFKKSISLLLTMTLLFGIAQPALAVMTDNPTAGSGIVVKDANGNVIEEDWETAFPYGTFVLAQSEVSIAEGEKEQRITVYRLGGTAGRATAYFQIAPAVTQLEDDTLSYANAAGKSDYTIQVEDTLPIAQYQPIGRPEDPLASGEQVRIVEENCTENTYDKDGNVLTYGDVPLIVEVKADSYQWYAYSSETGVWEAVEGATDSTLLIDQSMVEGYNYRCVYSIDGVQYSTDGLSGYKYEPRAEEELEPMPEDLELNPPQSFSSVVMEDGEFDAYTFPMTFAEGEWKKEIIISATDDEEAEADELAALTIVGCEGGSVYDTANTLAVHIADNDASEPSYVSFAVADYVVDKSDLTATLTLKRTGDLLQFLEVDYKTVDGAAVGGVDYAAVSDGKAYFPSGVDSVDIKIDLINDKVENLDSSLDFKVVLTALLGGGKGSALVGDTEATVRLFNSNSATETNAVTMLSTQEADDLSEAVGDTGVSLAGKSEPPAIKPVEQKAAEVLSGDVSFSDTATGGIEPLTHNYGAVINFNRGSIENYNSSYWQDYAWLANKNNRYSSYDVNDVEGYMTKKDNWSGDVKRSGNGWEVTSEQKASGYFSETDFTERFRQLTSYVTFDADLVSGWSTKNGASNPYIQMETGGSGGSTQSQESVYDYGTRGFLGLERYINYYTGVYPSWSVNGTDGGKIVLGIGRKGGSDWDAHGRVTLEDAVLSRRVLSNPLSLVIHTADDDVISASTVKDKLFNALKPSVSLVAGESGVNRYGNVYVGSQLEIKPAVTGSYQLAQAGDGALNQSIYLASGSNAKVNDALNRATVSKDKVGKLTIKTSSSSNNLDTNGNYSVNVVLDRVQRLEFDLTPSVPKKVIDGAASSEIDTDQINNVAADFWNKANITYTYASFNPSVAGNFEEKKGTISKNDMTLNKALLSLSNVKNLRTIDFNLPPEYIIVFDGVSYAGNETITIPVGRYTSGALNFLYYTPDFVTAENDMALSISHIERYIDANGNGKIDGYYDAGTGTFVLEKVGNVSDILVEVVEPRDYAITEFEPVYMDIDGNGNYQYVQQFFKVYYTMTPRSLVTPAGENEKKPAQVLPVFTTNVTNESVKSKLTEELQGYRFITSGPYSRSHYIIQTESGWDTVLDNPGNAAISKIAGAYSGDGKLMYTAAANMLESVDTPLGGNKNPIFFAWDKENNQPKLDKNGDPYYDMADWNPQYVNNLLYSFTNPAPIFINDTPLGDFIPVADVEEGAPQGYNVAELNNYLGSFNANDTLIVGVREQTQTTGEIKSLETRALSAMDADEPVINGLTIDLDTTNPTGTGTIPGSDNLRSMSAQDDDESTASGADSGESANSMSEMNVDMGIELPTLSFGLSDYITVIMDGYEVGFSIGVPLFKVESKTMAYTSGMEKDDEARKYNTEKSGPIAQNTEAMSKIKNAFADPKSLVQDEAWSDIKETQGVADKDKEKTIRAGAAELAITFNVTILFKYNQLDNKFKFSQAMFAFNLGVQYKFTARLTVCPILYAYFIIKLEVKVAGGVVVDRITDLYPEGTHTINFNGSSPSSGRTGTWTVDTSDTTAYKGDKLVGKEGSTLTVPIESDTVQITFSGKLGVKNAEGFDGFEGGYITSDGSEPVVVKTDSLVTGNGKGKLELVALEDGTAIDKLEQVKAIRNDTYFSGIQLSPSLFLEVGVGIGVEVLKVEIYFKASIGCSMSFATRVEDEENGGYKTEAFSFDSMEFRAGFGVRVVLLLFSFEMDVIQFGIDYRAEYDYDRPGNVGETSPEGFNKNGWKFCWYLANGTEELSLAKEGNDGVPGVKIFVPANTYYAQQIFGPEDGNSIMGQLEEYAYDPTDPNAPFQISGYSSSGDAFKLSENLVTGTDYQLVTVGQDNYLLYTVARELAPGESTVDSNMLVMSQIVNTGDKVGLYKPGTSETGYIAVDNDDTGDLDFSAWADGNTVYAAWVSYAEKYPAAPLVGEEPTMAKPEGMTAENYDDEKFVVEERPLVPKEPDKVTEPVQKDYWIDAETHQGLDPSEQGNYTLDDASGNYYKINFTSLAEAQNAFTQEDSKYQNYLTEYDEWKKADDAAKDWDTNKKAAYEAYIAWKNYYQSLADYNAYLQNQLSNAAKNTIVKTAACNVSEPSPAFGEPEIIGKDEEGLIGYMFSPQVADDGGVVFYASSVEMTPDQREAANKRHQSDYDAATDGMDVTNEGEYSTATSGDPTAAFRLAYNQSMDDVYGQNTVFNFAVADSSGTYHHYGYTPSGWAEDGMRLENVAMTKANDTTYYLAYTASKSDTVAGKTAIVRFLYLQPLTITNADTGEIELGTAVVLRKLYDAGENTNANDFGLTALTNTEDQYYQGMDGVYSGNQQQVAFEDPYFSNVRFLHGKLGALTGDPEKFDEELSFEALEAFEVNPETFLLFEMNGNTYVIPQQSLESITGSERTGSVIPFFGDTDIKGTRGNMAIGTDAEGNISAVYTDTVPNTTNNAIYVMKYDPGDGISQPSWGEGRMLAMNGMQVYEDSISQGWSADELEKAYNDPAKGGNMTSFVFSNLDVALGYKAALEDKISEQSAAVVQNNADGTSIAEKTVTVSQETGELEQQGAGNEQPSNESTLLILAQGTQTKLTTEAYADPNETTELIVPRYKDDGSLDSSTGFYAISFGVGEQNVGEGRISFYENDFTPGATLIPTISFKNTGDVPIRGSESNPITVSLYLSGEEGAAARSQELASWEVTGSIPVGTTISTYSETSQVTTTELPENLNGRKFYFKVSEDADYVADAYTYDSLTAKGGTTIQIQKLPELAVEDVMMDTAGMDGDQVVIDLNLMATNRGAADALGTYLQFSYQSGVDGNGDPVYSPIDLTGHNLTVSEQIQLETLDASTSEELKTGKLRLHGTDGSDNLNINHGRLVSGSFKMAKDQYCDATVTGSLNIKIEIFYEDSIAQQTLEASGLNVSNHAGELNSQNNSIYRQLEAQTFFTAPSKISVAVGTTTRLYIPAVTTRNSDPVITVSELSTTLDDPTTKHLGILYYSLEGGYLVVTPSGEGEGVIRMADTQTNSYIDIAFRATAAGEGINIFNDNDIFTFYDTAGNVYTSDTTGGHKDDWKFNQQQLNWGDGEVPYLYDLAAAKKGAKFTISTMADTMTLFFEGDITVESDYPGFSAKTLNYQGSTESVKNGVTIDFENKDNTPHTVTITVRSDTATFDKYSETYGTAGPPTPSDDQNAPQIYWSRNMPATASVAQGGKVTMTVYVIDDSGLNWITLNGENVKNLDAEYLASNSRFWQFEIAVDANTDFTVAASDLAGNVTTRPIKVDWFMVTEGETTDKTLTLDAKFVKQDGSPLTGSGFLNEAVYLAFAEAKPGESVTLYQWREEITGFEQLQQTPVDSRFSISGNGLYRIVKSTDDGVFESAVLLMDRIDSARPVIELKSIADDYTYFRYQVSKQDENGVVIPNGTEGVAPISYVKINGYDVEIPSNVLTVIQNYDLSFNGEYVLTAGDEAGNTVLTPLTVTITQKKVDLSAEGTVESVNSWNQDRNSGTVTVDASKITGGYYNSELQNKDNTYRGSYSLALVKRGETPADTDWTETVTNTTYTFTGIVPGEYDLYAKDALENPAEGEQANQAVMPVTIGDDAITFLTEAFGSESSYLKNAKLEVVAQNGISGEHLFAIYKIDEELHPDLTDLSWFDHTTMIGEPTYHEEEVVVKVPNPDFVDEDATPDEPPYIDETQKIQVMDTNVGVWLPKDEAGSLNSLCTFDEIGVGQYIVVVRDADDSVYADYTDSTAVGVVEVPLLNMGDTNLYPNMEEEDGAVRITLTEDHRVLSQKEQERAVWRNNFKDIIIDGLGIYCVIPQGTLKDGDDVNALFRNLTGKTAADGNVVVCTDKEGVQHIIVYSYVGDRIYYIASMAGTYSLIFNSKDFTDLRDDWAKDSIDFITARELFSGIGDGLFAPDSPMTRAMFVSVLYRLAGSPEIELEGVNDFTDVPADTWYSKAVAWASANDIVSGYGDGTFGPDDEITREQMCVIFALYMKFAGIQLDQSEEIIPFLDEESIGGYAREAVTLCQSTGLISGVGDNTFLPKGKANRDQVAAIFSRLIHKVLESKIK